MKLRLLISTAMLVLGLAAGTASSALAQDSLALTKKEAKKLVKQSEKDLNKAHKASQRAGEARRDVEGYVARYTESLGHVNRALASGNLEESDALDVAARVDEATLKHLPVLEGLLETAPEEAKPAIERALQISRTGHDTATEAILSRSQVSLPRGVLTERAARDAMEKNDALLKHAERARKRGDNATVARSVDQYTANISTVGRAIEQGAVDESEAARVLDRVDRNTRRHISVLEGLLDKVPNQAQAGIGRALEASRKGNQAATAAITRTPAVGVQTRRPDTAGLPSGIGARPGSAGSERRGRSPSGAGKPRGGPPK